MCTRSSSARVAARGCEVAHGIVGAGVVETGQHGLDPLRTLRMPAPGIVLGETRIGGHQQHVRLPRAGVRPSEPRRYGYQR